jgi:hypothetical protein
VAWVVGRHQLPDEMPPDSVLGDYGIGDVIVRTGKRWVVMRREEFDREYEWIDA